MEEYKERLNKSRIMGKIMDKLSVIRQLILSDPVDLERALSKVSGVT